MRRKNIFNSFEAHTKYEDCQTPFNVEYEQSRNLYNSQNEALDWVFICSSDMMWNT